MKSGWKLGMAAGAAWALAAGLCPGAPISFDPVQWESGNGDTLGWTPTGDATVNAPVAGGHPDGYLDIHFSAGFPPGPKFGGAINQGDGYTGSYADLGLTVRFDYLGNADMAQSLYFESGAGLGSRWSRGLTVSAHEWTSYTVSFTEVDGWSRDSGDQTVNFDTALTDVTGIGFDIGEWGSFTPFDYGLDNWQFQAGAGGGEVPEPGPWAIGLTALLGLAPPLGRPLRAALDRIRARRKKA